MSERPHPFDLIFGGIADERFPAIRAVAPTDVSLEEFLVSAPAIEVLRELRPEEGLGAGDDFVALVFAGYRYWADGRRTVALDEGATRALCRPVLPEVSAPSGTRYIQIAPRLIWASLDGGEQHEPLDGWFAVPAAEGMRVVAAFGVHPGRPGLSVLTVAGRLEAIHESRADGAALFSPTMRSGDVANLLSIASLEELLLLSWRAAVIGEGIDG